MKGAWIIALLWASSAAAQDQPDWVGGFMTDVSACWNISQADEPWPVVTVRFDMNEDGTPVRESFELIEASEATDLATRAAFEAVRRAVIRCAQLGYDLPPEEFALWDEIEMTFDPRSVVLP